MTAFFAVLQTLSCMQPNEPFPQGGPGSVRLRFGDGTVQAVSVFGSGGSSAKRVFCVQPLMQTVAALSERHLRDFKPFEAGMLASIL